MFLQFLPASTQSEFVTALLGDRGAGFHNGCKPLASADINEDIVYVVSGLSHFQVVNVLNMPACHGNTGLFHRLNAPEAPMLSIEKMTALFKAQSPQGVSGNQFKYEYLPHLSYLSLLNDHLLQHKILFFRPRYVIISH